MLSMAPTTLRTLAPLCMARVALPQGMARHMASAGKRQPRDDREADIPAEVVEPHKKGNKNKFRELVARYGAVAIGTHVGLGMMSLGAWYTAVGAGVDAAGLLEKVGISGSFATGASTFAVAYVAHKATAPIRVPLTIAVVPWVARKVKNIKRGVKLSDPK